MCKLPSQDNLEKTKQSVNPEIGVDRVWSAKYAGASPATLTIFESCHGDQLKKGEQGFESDDTGGGDP